MWGLLHRAPGSLRDLQLALQLKVEELRQRDALIDELELELDCKDDLIRQLQVELDRFRGAAQRAGKDSDTHRTKRHAFSTEAPPMDPAQLATVSITGYRKSKESRDLIQNALLDNDFMKHLDQEQIASMVDRMYPTSLEKGSGVIREGEAGSTLYVLEDGTVEVTKQGKKRSDFSAGKVFGELAVLHRCTCTAAVTALTDIRLWALDRQDFQTVTMRAGLLKRSRHTDLLRSVPWFQPLPEGVLCRLADALEETVYSDGEIIVRQGAPGDTFFLISEGQVKASQQSSADGEPLMEWTLSGGEWFGERCKPLNTFLFLEIFIELSPLLLFFSRSLKLSSPTFCSSPCREDVRAATVTAVGGATCLVIDRETFKRLVGEPDGKPDGEPDGKPDGELDREPDEEPGREPGREPDEEPDGKPDGELDREPDGEPDRGPDRGDDGAGVESRTGSDFFSGLSLSRFRIMSTLGQGGFGPVELVQLEDDPTRSFALKVQKKTGILQTGQQNQVRSERRILTEAHNPFIVRLYGTFRDSRCVYLLLEACVGGDLWSLLQDRGALDDGAARFYAGCVTEALVYLHLRGFVYRNLKPENLLLDLRGYVKLVDFRFAKKVDVGKKTWTFCGTPEYVAPEILLNRGHDGSVDCWALGILLFELLCGSPPFSGSDPLEIYSVILRGIDMIQFPRKVTKSATNLIKGLCRERPSERVGNQKNRLRDVQKHKWFDGFNWDGLRQRSIRAPFEPAVGRTLEHSSYDSFTEDTDEPPPDDGSGWDAEF
ncbi:cGMP-dependent protein kinase 1 [Oryzias melastigma]|uniref:cGMP-dependent protein kinase 1 n=1 Tax=Oryzias melastigma TaxID=30732 RepID=UPI00168CF13C|nr:cGMP-dependent protein kinase 1 [Oryzias melastigma]